MGIAPTWTVICKYSKDIALAGFVYDFAIAIGWILGIIAFLGKSFGIHQYIGILLMASGILVFKK